MGIGSFIADQLLPEGITEKLTFKKFDGVALAKAASEGKELESRYITRVALYVNPQEINTDSKKLTSRIPTNAPNRFIVLDWGNDLKTLRITGRTGNMMPDIIKNSTKDMGRTKYSLSNPLGSASNALNDGSRMALDYIIPAGNDTSGSRRMIYAGLSYFDLIELSPKYRAFKRLQKDIYENFDADIDILTLEMGPWIYRGHFEDFSFTIAADMPWEWKYSMTYVVLDDVTSSVLAIDKTYNDSAVDKDS